MNLGSIIVPDIFHGGNIFLLFVFGNNFNFHIKDNRETCIFFLGNGTSHRKAGFMLVFQVVIVIHYRLSTTSVLK